MTPASLLAGKAELVDNQRGSVDFSDSHYCYFLGFFFINSEITSTETPCNTVYCWIIPPATVQKPWTSETVLERRFRHQIWESHGAPGWGEMLSCPGEQQPPSNSSAIHQQSQQEFFLNECRAIFNLGTHCCSFVLVTLFMCGWRRPGEEGRAPGRVAPSWHLLSCSHSSQ